MIFKTVVTKWAGSHNENLRLLSASQTLLLNGSHINGLLVRDGNKSQFMYNDNPFDFRAKPSYVESTSTVAAIKAAADLTFQSTFVSLLVYPVLNDITTTPVATLINCESIAYVYSDPAYTATKSFVVYFEGSKRRLVRVNYSINQILSLLDDGNLTT